MKNIFFFLSTFLALSNAYVYAENHHHHNEPPCNNESLEEARENDKHQSK